jgi:hypothetical protein
MPVDLICGEPQFLDHTAPVIHALPARLRGRVLVEASLIPRARALGLNAEQWETPGPPNPVLVASWRDIKRARKLGRQRIAFIEHGAGQSYSGGGHQEKDPRCPHCHPSYAGGRGREGISLTLVPNEHSAGRFREAYPDMDVQVVGCPKLDTLPKREPGPGPVVAMSFHPNAYIGCSEADSAFRQYRNVIPQLSRHFSMIGHAHPLWAARVRPWFTRWSIPFVEDFADVCRLADVYAIDNSSTLFEFASTGRPVVVLNSRGYRPRMNHGLRFEGVSGCPITPGPHFCGAAHVGVQVNDYTQLRPAIERAIADPPEQRAARETALDIVYAYRSGAAKRAAKVLASWATERQVAAA